MKKDKLVLEYSNGGLFEIAWYLVEEGDLGARLGEGDKAPPTDAEVAAAETDEDWEHRRATQIAAASKGVEKYGYDPYRWERRADAQACLREINVVLKAGRVKPMPDWAVKAAAAGWKPPKGWKP